MDQLEIEAVFVDALQNLAESVTDLVGFQVAAISVARDDQTLETVAVAGSDSARAALLGHRTPIAEIEAELSVSEHWGDLRFVPHERMNTAIEDLGWVPDLEVSDDPEMWHPLDMLLAPFHDDHGRLRGILSVDVPLDLRRPSPAKQQQLQRYASHARRSLLTGIERAELAHQVRLADTARRIVRQVSSQLSIKGILEICQPAVCAGFDAVGMWIQTYEHDDPGQDAVYGATEEQIVVTDEIKALARAAAQLLWRSQEVAVVVLDAAPEVDGLDLPEDLVDRLHEFMATTLEAESMLFVPLGAGQECVGNMALTRRGDRIDWTLAEQHAALEIGHDLGRALQNARTFERERVLLEELRALESYKSRLIATVTHELRTPLTSVLGHLELMDTDALPGPAAGAVQAVERGAQRMRQMVDDLSVLSQVEDPHRVFTPVPVDLCQLVRGVLDLYDVTVSRRGLDVTVDGPDAPVLVSGDPVGLDWMCANLIGNAVKFTPDAGSIAVSIAVGDDAVELSVRDTGVGISEADQERMFEEFYRSADAAVATTPGTGLGLAIVQRVVEHHDGTITVDSAPGEGSTFTVSLPVAVDQSRDDRRTTGESARS